MDKVDLSNRRVVIALAAGFSPMVLWGGLNFLRPDLLQPMLDHLFGYAVTAAQLLLMLGSAIVYVIAALQKGGTSIGIAIAGFIVCTLPVVFLMLFGPIVFAFMYSDAH